MLGVETLAYTQHQITSFRNPLLHNMPSWCVLSLFSRVWLFATLWTVAHQAPLSMGFSRQKYWSGFPCPLPGDFPDPGIEPASLTSTHIGRQVPYRLPHLGSSNMSSGSLKCRKQSFKSSDNVFRFPLAEPTLKADWSTGKGHAVCYNVTWTLLITPSSEGRLASDNSSPPS